MVDFGEATFGGQSSYAEKSCWTSVLANSIAPLPNVFAQRLGLGAIGNQPIARRTGTQQPDHVMETAKHKVGIVDPLAAGGQQQRHGLAVKPREIGARAVEIHQAIRSVDQRP